MNTANCPKCGHQQATSDVCAKCGVIISKYLAAVERQKPQQAAGHPVKKQDDSSSSKEGRKLIAIIVVILLIAGLYFAKDSSAIPSPVREIMPRVLFSKKGNIYGTTPSGKNLYINYYYRFSMEIPKSWNTYTAKETIDVPVILEMFGDMYYYITGPRDSRGPILNITKASFEYESFSFADYVEDMADPAYWTQVFDKISLKNGLTTYKSAAILKSQDSYRENAVINTPGGMMEIFFVVRNQSSSNSDVLLMQEIIDSLKKI